MKLTKKMPFSSKFKNLTLNIPKLNAVAYTILMLVVFTSTNTFGQVCASTVNIPPAGVVTVNGVQITSSFTGSVTTYPNPYASCLGTAATSANSLYVGPGGVFAATLSFNQPVNDLIFVINATGQNSNENFIFNAGPGNPCTITDLGSCYSVIVGNEILSGAGGASTGGGGTFQITRPTPYTTLTISGSGGNAGALMAICGMSITTNPCVAGSVAPTLSATSLNIGCLTATVNLDALHTGVAPVGTVLIWSTDNNSSNGLDMTGNAEDTNGDGTVNDPTTVAIADTYYAYYYDPISDCYSPVSTGVVVSPFPLPIINAGLDQTVCNSGGTVTLSGSGGVSYLWNNGVTNGTPFTPTLGTTTYTVTGTDANGCTNTDQANITVNPLPTINAGLDQTVCNDGSTITLSGAGGVSYIWDNGVTNGAAFVPNVGITTYTVTGTDANGCTNTDQIDLTVNALPTINAGLDQTVCNDGSTATLSGSGGTSYIWDNGVTDGLAFTPPLGTTTYTVTGTDANGCSNTDQMDVTVNPLPTIDAGLDQILTCNNGTTVTLSGSGGTIYTWDNGVIDGVAFIPPTGTTIYTVTGTDIDGCSNTDQVQVDATLNSLPSVDAGPDQLVCNNGTTVTLFGGGAVSYVWDNGIIDGTPFVPALGTTTYTVTGTDANGCQNTDQVDVSAGALPAVSTTTQDVTCFDECDGSVLFNPTNPPASYIYSWGQGVVGDQNGTAFNLCNGAYSVDISDASGCSITVDYVINQPSNVEPILLGDDLNGCMAHTVNFQDLSVVNPAEVASVTVDFGDGASETVATSGLSFIHEYLFDGIYSVSISITTINGCVYIQDYPNLVEVYVNPTAYFSVSDPTEITELNSTTNLINQSSSSATIFNWTLPNANPSNSTNEDVYGVTFPHESGTYPVTLHVVTDFGCMDTITLDVLVLEDLIYYIPNTFTPDNDEHNQTFQPVFTSGFDPFDFQLLIFNRWGEVIFESNDATRGWDGTYNGALVQDGVYTWKVEFKLRINDERKVDAGNVNLIR